ncbi:DUF4007 family protein [Candidatus Poribacteria bacterium]|nr:DUF4007 family protein [Candidatus Poribacteria bacterium]MYK95730.1 DUF4007 family protein [Candidatus Poribacteria bacterium]
MENFLITEHITPPNLTNPSFSGHQTFPFRYTWLKKGVDAVTDNATVFSSEDAFVTLGVGKNMVSSIRHWCTVARLIKADPHQRRRLVPTEFGKSIFNDKNGFDPYLEDPATLWLIHWQITTNINQATTWYWAFNVLRKNQFVSTTFTEELYKWAQQQKESMKPVSDNTLQRDVNCFIRTYCQSRHTAAVVEESFDSPLVELNLIAELPEGNGYEFQRGEKETLPVEIFTATLVAFWDLCSFERDTLPFSDLMYAPLSPGRIFRLDEDTMTAYLENLAQLTNEALQYDETAGLKQVYRRKNLNLMKLLERHYE